jgi:hypothetical protein
MSDFVGVTFPIHEKFCSRFFESQKKVFIKPAMIFSYLKPGMTFIFYQSQTNTGYVGEATIKSITFSEDPFSFYEEFGDKIFLTKPELEEYLMVQKKWKYSSKKPQKRKWIAIELVKIQKYQKIIKPKNFVTVSGRYITKEERETIIG